MNPYETYRQQRAFGMTRIDMLLSLYDGGIERLEQARAAIEAGDAPTATAALLRAKRIVVELLGGLDLSYGEVPRNLERLFVYVLMSIEAGTAREIDGALDVLHTLHDALQAIRDEAVALERSGAIPAADSIRALQAIA